MQVTADFIVLVSFQHSVQGWLHFLSAVQVKTTKWFAFHSVTVQHALCKALGFLLKSSKLLSPHPAETSMVHASVVCLLFSWGMDTPWLDPKHENCTCDYVVPCLADGALITTVARMVSVAALSIQRNNAIQLPLLSPKTTLSFNDPFCDVFTQR